MARVVTVSSALALAWVLAGASASAQTVVPEGTQPPAATAGQVGIGEIVVTAQRRSESLQKVPASVEVVSGAQLQAAHISNLANVQEITPSLVVTQSSNPSAGVFTIRGVGTSVTDRGFEQSVGVYIDGVYRGRPGAALQDLLDIDRVEVLRGPQSTLFGRNNAAGAINITTSLPDPKAFGVYGEATYGNYNDVQVRGSVNVPIVTDTLAIRVSAAENRHDGYIKAPNLPNGDVNALDRQAYRAQLYWTPTASTRVRLIGDYSELHDRCCSYLPLFVATADSTLPYSPFPPYHGTLYGFTPPSAGIAGTSPSAPTVPGITYNPFNRVSTQDNPTKESSNDGGVSLQVDQDIGNGLTLTAIGSARRYNTHITLDIDGTNSALENLQSLPSTTIDEQTAELRLQNRSGSIIEFVLGGYYFHQKIIDTNVLDATIKPEALTVPVFDSVGDGRTSSGAAFGQATYNVTSTVRITGGLRYLNESKDTTVAVAPGTSSFGGSASTNNSALMGSATIAWQPSSAANFYARYARGYKSAAINLLFTLPTAIASPAVKPETTNAYEIGAKLKLIGNTLTANVAAYTQTVNDQQVQTFDSLTGTFTTLNAAKVRSRGVESDLLYRPIRALTFSGGISYLDAKYLNFVNAPPQAGSTALTQDLTGQATPNAPHWTLVGGMTFNQPLTDSITLVANGTIRHATSYFTDLPDSAAFKNGKTNLVDASLDLQFKNGFGIQFWGRNLTKQNYFLTGLGTPGTQSSLSAFVNDPRTYGVTLRFRH